MTSSLEFPSVCPGGWNVPVLLQYLTGVFLCAKNASEEGSPKEDAQPVKEAFR